MDTSKIQKEDDVTNLNDNNYTYLTIDSIDIEKIKKDLDMKIIYENDSCCKFINNLKPNELLDKITKYKINKILIEDISIEDLFMEYYK